MQGKGNTSDGGEFDVSRRVFTGDVEGSKMKFRTFVSDRKRIENR